jgi:hypothetical protein
VSHARTTHRVERRRGVNPAGEDEEDDSWSQ